MNQQPRGWLEVITGPMYSGKTEELLRRMRRATIAGMVVRLFKPAIDDRYRVDTVSSHNGQSMSAIPLQRPIEVVQHLQGASDRVQVVGIDEAQFFGDDLPQTVEWLLANGIRVIVAGLDLDFARRPFGPMPILLAMAKDVIKLHAICNECARLGRGQVDAHYTQRLINHEPAHLNDPIVLVGGFESYEARCENCHKIRGEKVLPLDV